MRRFCLAVAGIILGYSGLAHATDIVNIPGMGCMPYSSTIQNNRYTTGFFGVKLTSGTSAQFICPIPHGVALNYTTWNKFHFSYIDSDGSGSNYTVSVTLYKAEAGGNYAEAIGSTCTSNETGKPADEPHEFTGTMGNGCDFTNFTPSNSYSYFFYVAITRGPTDTETNTELLNLRLTN